MKKKKKFHERYTNNVYVLTFEHYYKQVIQIQLTTCVVFREELFV